MRADSFEKTVGGVAFAALLTFIFMVGGVWQEQDAGLSRAKIEQVR